MKVYLYSRVSTSEQTLQQQERTALEWLKAHDLQVDEIISDEGISGGVSYQERNLGKILVPKLAQGDLLIVSEISRLGRSMFDLSKLINTELKQKGVRLVIVSMNIDLRCDKITAIDELILNNFAFAAQLEKQLIKERTKSALQAKRQQGVKFGRANENYLFDEETQLQGRIKASMTKLNKTLSSNEFKSFCRILARSYKSLQGNVDLLQGDVDLFMKSLLQRKNDVLKETNSDVLQDILVQMKIAHENNSELFRNYTLDATCIEQQKIVRAKIHNTFRTISAYQLYINN